MSTKPIDFGDLGGKRVVGPADFSDLGGVKVDVGASAPQQPGLLRRAWNAINTPLADFVLPKDIKTSDLIKAHLFEKIGLGPYIPGVNDEHTVAEYHLGDSPSKSALKTFVGGSLKDTADTAAGFTSPLSLAMMGAGEAAQAPGAVGKVARALSTTAAAGFGAKGAHDIYEAGADNTPEAWQQRLQGGAMLTGGVAGTVEGLRPDPASLRASAEQQYQQALHPTKQRTKYTAEKRTPEMLDRGIRFSSADELATRAEAQAAIKGEELDQTYSSLPSDRRSATQPILDAMDEYKQQFIDRSPMTEQAVRGELAKNKGELPANIQKAPDGSFYREIVLDPNAVNAADTFKGIISKYGDDIGPESMRKARQVFDSAVARAGGYEGRSLPEGSYIDAQREAASAIRGRLAEDNPELVPLNKEINFWLDVQRMAKETAQRQVGQQGGLIVPLAEQAGRAGGAAVGAQVAGVKGAALGSYLGGKIMGKLAGTVRSPLWRTTSAVMKNKLADALSAGRWQQASSVLDAINGGVISSPSSDNRDKLKALVGLE